MQIGNLAENPKAAASHALARQSPGAIGQAAEICELRDGFCAELATTES